MKDHLLLELDLDEGGWALHLFDHEHRIIAVISDPVSVSRYDGWISVVHQAHGRHAETYIPADRFSHLTLLHPIQPEESE